MKFKSVLAIAAIAAAGAASATVTSDNTLCRIRIDSGLLHTIVSIPLAKVGDGANISIPSLILTNNMAVGDSILHWNTTEKAWDTWVMSSESGWTGGTSVTGIKSKIQAAGEGTTLARGEAIWVNRSASVTNTPFYVYGQIATSGNTVTITGNESAATYTMVGNPHPDAFSLASMTGWTCIAGDSILVSEGNGLGVKTYLCRYNSETGKNGWKTLSGRSLVWVTADDLIPAGQGFWYVTTTTSDVREIIWPSDE